MGGKKKKKSAGNKPSHDNPPDLKKQKKGEEKRLIMGLEPKEFYDEEVAIFDWERSSVPDFRDRFSTIASVHKDPNILRSPWLVEDGSRFFFALDQYVCRLEDLVKWKHPRCKGIEKHGKFNNVIETTDFWDANGFPLPPLKEVLRDILNGVFYLQKRGVYAKLSATDIVITNYGKLSAEINLMCARFEVCEPDDNKRKENIKEIGKLLFYVLSGGQMYEAESELVKYVPDADDLIKSLVDHNRSVKGMLRHPFFWDSDRCLHFLADLTNFMNRKKHYYVSTNKELKFLIKDGSWSWIFGTNVKAWNAAQLRAYSVSSPYSLIRVLRNACEHFEEDIVIRDILGQDFALFQSYRVKCPELMSKVYWLADNIKELDGICRRQFLYSRNDKTTYK